MVVLTKAMKEIKNPQRCVLYQRYFHLLGMLVLLGLLSSCTTCKLIKMMLPHKVSHAGFSVVVPGDWGDYTHEGKDRLCVARIWGTTDLTIAKLPGSSEELLALFRDVWVKAPNDGSEETISQWYSFKGLGYRFRNNGAEGVLFYPQGQYSGWYIRAVISEETGARKGFEQVIHSLKREVNSSDKP